MMKDDFNRLLADFKEINKNNLPTDYCSIIQTLQDELKGKSLMEWIIDSVKKPSVQAKKDELDPVADTLYNFDSKFKDTEQIGHYSKSVCKEVFSRFARYIIGFYHANAFFRLDSTVSEVACKLIAQNAIFCTVEVAKKVNEGTLKSRKYNGNVYYSWFDCKYQRKHPKQQAGNVTDKNCHEQEGSVTLENNLHANKAIKNAVLAGYPKQLHLPIDCFKDYMACHIWDNTCYDAHYNTSVFNLVLVPNSIAGFTDYIPEVKRLLQYEAAMRFGVFPRKFVPKNEDYSEVPTYYDLVEQFWRQPEEHNQAKRRKENGELPIGI